MSRLDQIPIVIDTPNNVKAPSRDDGHVLPILNETRHALERLIATGAETRIDLNAMPFGPGDLERLTALLGTGEVRASVEAMGPTHVTETAIPGVWLVDYRDSEAQRLTLHLEVASIPEILRTQRQDLETAIALLDARLKPEPEQPASTVLTP